MANGKDYVQSVQLLVDDFFQVKTTGYMFQIKIFCCKSVLQCVITYYETNGSSNNPRLKIYCTISSANDLQGFKNILDHLANSYCDTDCENDSDTESISDESD